MPTVLRMHGFQVRIYPPPREHGPAHVHVIKGNSQVVVELAAEGQTIRIRSIAAMRDVDVIAAVRLVENHLDFLWAQWRTYHG